MKPQRTELSFRSRNEAKKISIIGIIIITFQLIFHLTVGATSHSIVKDSVPDSLLLELNNQLNNPLLLKRLNFPKTVKRFYVLNNLQPNWLREEQNVGSTTSAMLLLDCIKHYGLQHENYHPEILNYALMHDILNRKNIVTAAQKIEFELMLTDAMVSMINHLHYGRLNPSLSEAAIDNGSSLKLRADEFLINVANSPYLMDSILTVQPKIKQYQQLQDYLRLITGQYACDSFELPEPEIREIALNMERLRWTELNTDKYLQVNIPSFYLSYITRDSITSFKVVIGKPSTPTPTLLSEILYIETAPDWRIPKKIFIKELLPRAEKDIAYFENNHITIYDEKGNIVEVNKASIISIKKNSKKFHFIQSSGCDNALGKVVFRFNNPYDIYLHDTPEQQYFTRSNRALSHGCIRVEQAENLGALLLTHDDQHRRVRQLTAAMKAFRKQKFSLKVPMKILITYLTATVEDGLLTRHEDIYKLDTALEAKMYPDTEKLTNIIPKK